MSYMALYRKFRPTEFDDVKGQEHIVTTLKNQIKAERIGHAYLFCGTRGTGKTTVAKIFAKAVNCEQPAVGNPCGECAACRSIAAGTSMNVIEIDAASNTGVDNIREIRDEVAYSPTEGRYKVYIIDEVHMLSIGAFNALLKTLEEPPSYVIFILATTEAHKIPTTILSRCQRYDFRRITADTITARMEELTRVEGVEAEEKALRYIAKAADGSMRDALSLLDQCIAFYLDQELTYDHVLEVLGAVDTAVYSALLRSTLDQNLPDVMEQIEKLVIQGKELGQFVTDFTWYLRNLLLLKSSDHMEDILDVSTENLMQLKEEALRIESDTLMRYIRIFSELGGRIRYATQKRVLVEVAFIKLCKPSMEPNTDGLLDRIRALEKQMEEGIAAMPAALPIYEGDKAQEKKRTAEPVAPKALPEDVRLVVKNWDNVVNQLHPLLRTYLKDAKLKALGDNRLGILAASSTKEEFIKDPGHLSELQAVILKGTGKEIALEIASFDNDPYEAIGEIDMNQVIHMEIEIEEE